MSTPQKCSINLKFWFLKIKSKYTQLYDTMRYPVQMLKLINFTYAVLNIFSSLKENVKNENIPKCNIFPVATHIAYTVRAHNKIIWSFSQPPPSLRVLLLRPSGFWLIPTQSAWPVTRCPLPVRLSSTYSTGWRWRKNGNVENAGRGEKIVETYLDSQQSNKMQFV